MAQLTTNAGGLATPEGSLSDTIGRLRSEFTSLRHELRDAKSENCRLRREIDRWRARFRPLGADDIASLRRSVAFYCHPDRGGNGELMSRLNALFDVLAGQELTTRIGTACQEGRAA